MGINEVSEISDPSTYFFWDMPRVSLTSLTVWSVSQRSQWSAI